MDAESAEYLRAVETWFVALRGSGLMLSPRDVALVERWRTRGVPLRVLHSALEQGVERFRRSHPPRTPLPSTLAYFEAGVEQVIESRRAMMVGSVEPVGGESPAGQVAEAAGAAEAACPDLRQLVLDAVVSAGKAQEDEAARQVLREAWRRISQAPPSADIFALTGEVDGEIVGALLAAADGEVVARVEREAEARVDERGGAQMSERAWSERVDWERAKAVRAHYGIPELMGVLLEQSDM